MQKEINSLIDGFDVNACFYFTTHEVEATITIDGEDQYFYYNDVVNVPQNILINEITKSALYRYRKAM
jgi:hypothetical protein